MMIIIEMDDGYLMVYYNILKYILLIMVLQLCQLFPLCPTPPGTPLPSSNPPPPQFTSMGRAYKFFGLTISYTFLNIPLSVLYLPIHTSYSLHLFPHSPSSPFPADNPPCDLHFCDSVPVLVVCLVCLCFYFFQVQLLIVVSCCHFTVHSFDFFSQISPFNISYNRGLVMMNSFNLPYLGSTLSALPF